MPKPAVASILWTERALQNAISIIEVISLLDNRCDSSKWL